MEKGKKHTICPDELGMDLSSGQESEYFKWFLACLLFGKPIQQEVAKRTYFAFVKEGLTTPEAIIQAGWNKLVKILDRGHYVHYDFSTATKLLDVSKQLLKTYGTVTNMLQQVNTKTELSKKLQTFTGVGPVTAHIFVRELQLISCDRNHGNLPQKRVKSTQNKKRYETSKNIHDSTR